MALRFFYYLFSASSGIWRYLWRRPPPGPAGLEAGLPAVARIGASFYTGGLVALPAFRSALCTPIYYL